MAQFFNAHSQTIHCPDGYKYVLFICALNVNHTACMLAVKVPAPSSSIILVKVPAPSSSTILRVCEQSRFLRPHRQPYCVYASSQDSCALNVNRTACMRAVKVSAPYSSTILRVCEQSRFLRPHRQPYCVYATSQCSDETARSSEPSLLVFNYDKYHKFMDTPINIRFVMRNVHQHMNELLNIHFGTHHEKITLWCTCPQVKSHI